MRIVTSGWGLSDVHEHYRSQASSFAEQFVRPSAERFEEEEAIPRSLFDELSRRGYLGINVCEKHGGAQVDNVRIGLLHEALGAALPSVSSILTVHGMVCEVMQRWGSTQQQAMWLPRLASGGTIAAFALTEPEAGSDAKAIAATATKRGSACLLNGQKNWITGGQLADIFLIFAKYGERESAFLVERGTPGLSLAPIRGMLGLRAAMLASMTLDNCEVPLANRIGGHGLGIDAVASTALDFGRFVVSWACVGIAHACLDISFGYAAKRRQFGKLLRDHQLVAAMLTDMIADVGAAALVCLHAARLRDLADPAALLETCVAKYTASRTCARVASDAVQIHGAYGCGFGHAAQRLYRDAKVMEIIEGSSQIHQTLIARLAYEISRENRT